MRTCGERSPLSAVVSVARTMPSLLLLNIAASLESLWAEVIHPLSFSNAQLAAVEPQMEFRRLGHSGLRVPVLSFGTATFGGGNDFFKAWGSTDKGGASRLIDVCLDHGVCMFDSADGYSAGLAEEILGAAIKGKRDRLLISTKATFPTGAGPNDFGSSRQHLVDAVEKALKRLGADHIDLFQLHGQDFNTPVEETLSALDQLVRDGKIRYIGA